MQIYKYLKKIIFILLTAQFYVPTVHNQSAVNKIDKIKAEMLNRELRKIITNNVFWARSYIISELSDLPDKAQIKERLLKNQEGFGKILTKLYGKKESDKLTELLREHKSITVDLIQAVKLQNKKLEKKLEANWYKNINDIAVFINKLNPKWPANSICELFTGILKLTKTEMVLRSEKKWEADIQNFDKIVDYASYMADTLTKLIS